MSDGKDKDISFTIIDEETVKKLKRDGKVELPEKKISIPKDERWNERQMASKLLQGIQNGDSPRVMAKNMQEVIGNNETSAMRNVRTMHTSAESAGRLESYKKLAEQGVVQKKIWQATADDRTRPSHIDIDGEEQDIDKPFSNGCMYPGDGKGPADEVWNCRCAMSDNIIGFLRADGSISYVKYAHEEDETMHSKQMAEEKERRNKLTKAPVTTSTVVNGKDITSTWTRRADEFDYEIEDVINAQGFDGLPRVVDAEEFDRYVEESNFIAQRGYKAPNEETLKAYQDSLYNGKWYVDCKGGSQYGKGMYAGYNEGTKIGDDLVEIGKAYSGKNGIVETFTLDKNAKIISYDEAVKLEDDYRKNSREIKSQMMENAANSIADKLNLNNFEKDYLYERYFEINTGRGDEVVDWYNKLSEKEADAIDKKISDSDVDKIFRSIESMKLKSSEIAVLQGYDAIKVEDEGYLIVLNRTKVIFKRD